MKSTILTAFITIIVWEYRYNIIHVVEALAGN